MKSNACEPAMFHWVQPVLEPKHLAPGRRRESWIVHVSLTGSKYDRRDAECTETAAEKTTKVSTRENDTFDAVLKDRNVEVNE